MPDESGRRVYAVEVFDTSPSHVAPFGYVVVSDEEWLQIAGDPKALQRLFSLRHRIRYDPPAAPRRKTDLEQVH